MIRTIRHKGLKRLFEQDDPSGVNPNTPTNCVIFWPHLMPRLLLPIWNCRDYGCIRSKAS
jgi:hypothetical protein